MQTIKPVRTEADYQAALARIDELMDAASGSREGAELDVLADLVELYETRHEPMGSPSPVAAIEFRMDQAGLRPRDLVPFIGSRAKVSEVLSGKRTLTMPMARALHKHLGIPAEVLLRKPDIPSDKPLTGIEWHRFPLKEMAKRGWIPTVPDLAKHAEELIGVLLERAGGLAVAPAVPCTAKTTISVSTPRRMNTPSRRGAGTSWQRRTKTGPRMLTGQERSR